MQELHKGGVAMENETKNLKNPISKKTVLCPCGKTEHKEEANYCSDCGRKLSINQDDL